MHSGEAYQRKAYQRKRSGGALFPQKVDDFLVIVVMFKPTPNVQTFKRQNSVLKIWQLIGGGRAVAGDPVPWYNRHNGQSGPGLMYKPTEEFALYSQIVLYAQSYTRRCNFLKGN